jgi:hypothetical protein
MRLARKKAKRRRLVVALGLILSTILILAVTDVMPAIFLADSVRLRAADDQRIPVAALGDSDSHGFQDKLCWPPGSKHRGGAYRDTTLQWTEVLAQLRPDQVDLGDRGIWGTRRRVAGILAFFGIDRRAPRKQDHQYNFAFGAAHCHDLATGLFRQVPRLLDLMRHQPGRWRNGIVNLGGASELSEMAQDPTAVALTEKIRACTAHIEQAVAEIREQHAETRVLLVGILNNADFPPLLEKWRSSQEIANIDLALDQFDGSLRQLAERDPRIAFFDDREWFRTRWGARGPDGMPAYRQVAIGNALQVTHSMGDAPTNSILADGHAGMVWNILWAQSVSAALSGELGLPIEPIGDLEVQQFAASQLAAAHR